MEPTKSDEMTPKERMDALVAGKPIDRIPCFPLITDHACRVSGIPISRCFHSAELMSEAVIGVFRTYHPDGVMVTPTLHGIAEAMGSKLAFPEDGSPFVSDPLLKNYADLDRLSPADPTRNGRLPLCLEALRRLYAQIGDEVWVFASVGGPFTTAAGLRGTEYFLKDLHKKPDMAHRLLQVITQSILNYVDAAIDTGARVLLVEPTASGSLISPHIFRQFDKPCLKKIADRCIERSGMGPMLHICGDTAEIWADMADTGARILSLDHLADLAGAKEAVGNRVCLFGNVDPVRTLTLGTREQIHAETKACLRKAYDSPGGYILSSGCTVPPETSRLNVLAFMEAGRTYGRLPIDSEQLLG